MKGVGSTRRSVDVNADARGAEDGEEEYGGRRV